MIRNVVIIICLLFITATGFYLSRRTASPSASHTETLNTIIIGTNADFPPFSFIENQEIVGFDIDIAQEVAKRLNKKAVFKNMSFEALIPEIQLGYIHVIAAGMTPTDERAKRVNFTTPHFDKDQLMIIQQKNAPDIENVDELKGKSIIVNQGYTADNYASTIDDANIIRISSPLVSTGLMALSSGKADAYIASQSSIVPFLEKQPIHNFKFTPIKDTQEIYALAVSKKFPSLYKEVDETIQAMKNDGTITSLYNKWFGTQKL